MQSCAEYDISLHFKANVSSKDDGLDDLFTDGKYKILKEDRVEECLKLQRMLVILLSLFLWKFVKDLLICQPLREK